MKLFDCDWSEIARTASAWERLPHPCKILFIRNVEINTPLVIERIRADWAPLLKEGFLDQTPDGARLGLPPARQDFRRVVRALERHPLFRPDYERQGGLTAYLDEHFTHMERQALVGLMHRYSDVNQALTLTISQPSRLERFLAEKDFRRWPPSQLRYAPPLLLPDTATLLHTQKLLRVLRDATNPLTLPQVAATLRVETLADYGPALRAAIGLGLAFPALAEQDLAIVIGIWPGIHRKLHRKTIPPPTPVAAAEKHVGAFLMDDMTTLLVACAGEPLRLRQNDGALFAKAQAELSRRLGVLPEWFLKIIAYTPNNRLATAQAALALLKLGGIARQAGSAPSLDLTPAGTRWLRLEAGERLKLILDALRADIAVKLDLYGYAQTKNATLPFMDRIPDILLDSKPFDLRPALLAAFAALPVNQDVHLDVFLDYEAYEHNPLMRQQLAGHNLTQMYSWSATGDLTDEALVDIWRNTLKQCLNERLVPLGCATIGRTREQQATLALTAAGQYLLGQVAQFAYGGDEAHEIIVQPNFDIVFMAPSPAAEAAIAPLADRVGHRLGVLFKLTRRSIHTAFAAGWDAEIVLTRLTGLIKQPLPDNVGKQIRDWFAQCRRIEVKQALLFRCPDHETALRVVSAGGNKLVLLAPTVVELTDRKALKAIEKKLRQNGITRAPSAPKPPPPATEPPDPG